jgi:hypothetical protein
MMQPWGMLLLIDSGLHHTAAQLLPQVALSPPHQLLYLFNIFIELFI